MKQNIPAKTVEVCDFCHREGYLETCWVCGRQYCLSDQGTVPGSFGFTKLCPGCADRDDVRMICNNYAEKIGPIFKQRDRALQHLRGES